MTPEQKHFLEEVFVGILTTNITVFIAIVWRFVSAVTEVPRMKKGMRILFERIEKLEKEKEK